MVIYYKFLDKLLMAFQGQDAVARQRMSSIYVDDQNERLKSLGKHFSARFPFQTNRDRDFFLDGLLDDGQIRIRKSFCHKYKKVILVYSLISESIFSTYITAKYIN